MNDSSKSNSTNLIQLKRRKLNLENDRKKALEEFNKANESYQKARKKLDDIDAELEKINKELTGAK